MQKQVAVSKTNRRLPWKISKQALFSLLWKIVRLVILLGLCYIILYPFFVKIMNSFKLVDDFLDPTVRFIPTEFTLENIETVMAQMDYWPTLLNTSLSSVALGLIQMIVSALIGYGLARFKFKGNNLLFFVVILTLIVPPQTILVPLFMKFRFFMGFLNLVETSWPMVILSATGLGLKNGLYIFLFRQIFKNMPKELEEAAYLDGCGAFKTFVRIMLPSATSMMVTVFLLSFSWLWTDTTYSSLFLTDFPVLSNVVNTIGVSGIPIMAANYKSIAALLSILPIALLYIFAQRLFVQSIDRAGLVG